MLFLKGLRVHSRLNRALPNYLKRELVVLSVIPSGLRCFYGFASLHTGNFNFQKEEKEAETVKETAEALKQKQDIGIDRICMKLVNMGAKIEKSPDFSAGAEQPRKEEEKPTRIRFIHITKAGNALFWGGLIILCIIQINRLREENSSMRDFESIFHLDIGGPFDMIDTEGRPFTDKDLEKKWTLLYFGFVHCPDICPDTLEKLSEILYNFSPVYLKQNLNCIFVTVDPERDTPECLKEYLKNYHPAIKGITGTREQVDHMTKMYKAFGRKSFVSSENDYIVDHTVFIYLLGPDGRAINYFFREHESSKIAEKIRKKIADTHREIAWRGKGTII